MINLTSYINHCSDNNIKPVTNELYPENSYLPDRLRSISIPSIFPVVSEELSTISAPLLDKVPERENIEVIK